MSTTVSEIELGPLIDLSMESKLAPQEALNLSSDGHVGRSVDPSSPSRLRSISMISILTGVSFLNTLGSGILTVALPRLSRDLDLEPSLILWPASVYALTAGCTLLIFGAIADVVGARNVWLAGSCLFAVFTLACGLAQTGTQFIAFRAVLGIAIAMCLPSSVSLITSAFERGTWRNVGFASMGVGQPLGYSLGLILGGVFTDTIGWRYGYYISGIINAFLVIGGFVGLPSVVTREGSRWQRLLHGIDWIGASCLSISLALLSFTLA
jgi:MFS family permease